MKVIVAGGRFFSDYDLVRVTIDRVLSALGDEPIEIVSGRCSTGIPTFVADDGTEVCGADGLGEKYAKSNGYAVKLFPANWKKYGKSAGFKRNVEMANYADALIVFWDGKSPGSKNMIQLANSYGLQIAIVPYKN